MRLRIAKKVMNYNPNGKLNYHFNEHLRKLRPAYINETGVKTYPSFHDIHIVNRAYYRLFKWIRRVRDKYKDKYATVVVSNGDEELTYTSRIVSWDKKYVWLSNNPEFSGIRVPWSDVVKVE